MAKKNKQNKKITQKKDNLEENQDVEKETKVEDEKIEDSIEMINSNNKEEIEEEPIFIVKKSSNENLNTISSFNQSKKEFINSENTEKRKSSNKNLEFSIEPTLKNTNKVLDKEINSLNFNDGQNNVTNEEIQEETVEDQKDVNPQVIKEEQKDNQFTKVKVENKNEIQLKESKTIDIKDSFIPIKDSIEEEKLKRKKTPVIKKTEKENKKIEEEKKVYNLTEAIIKEREDDLIEENIEEKNNQNNCSFKDKIKDISLTTFAIGLTTLCVGGYYISKIIRKRL